MKIQHNTWMSVWVWFSYCLVEFYKKCLITWDFMIIWLFGLIQRKPEMEFNSSPALFICSLFNFKKLPVKQTQFKWLRLARWRHHCQHCMCHLNLSCWKLNETAHVVFIQVWSHWELLSFLQQLFNFFYYRQPPAQRCRMWKFGVHFSVRSS